MTIVFALLVFSFLIFIHELGHFLAAKAFGVQVNEFALFMGPAIFQKKVGETLYSLRCIPFGGYCAMEGEDSDTDSARSFQKAAWWKRMIILLAGAFMTLVSGMLILLLVFSPSQQFITPEVALIEEGCALAGEYGIQVGDRFVEVDGERIYDQSDFSVILSVNGGDVHDLVLERNGEKVILDDFRMEKREFPNEDGTTTLRYGFSFGVEDANFGTLVKYTWNNTLSIIRSVRLSLKMLFTGQAGLRDMSGPVGIVSLMAETAQQSATWVKALMNMLYLGGFLAVNLAVMNLLPIPALDGGRAACLVITVIAERITGRKIDPKYEGYLHAVFLLLLLGLMALITFKDVFTIFKR